MYYMHNIMHNIMQVWFEYFENHNNLHTAIIEFSLLKFKICTYNSEVLEEINRFLIRNLFKITEVDLSIPGTDYRFTGAYYILLLLTAVVDQFLLVFLKKCEVVTLDLPPCTFSNCDCRNFHTFCRTKSLISHLAQQKTQV